MQSRNKVKSRLIPYTCAYAFYCFIADSFSETTDKDEIQFVANLHRFDPLRWEKDHTRMTSGELDSLLKIMLVLICSKVYSQIRKMSFVGRHITFLVIGAS